MKKLLALTICFMFMGVGSVFAELLKVHTWTLGAEVSNITYTEYVNSQVFMKESGIMYGIAGSYAYHKNLMLKVNGRLSYGQVDYKNSGTIENIDDYILEVRGAGGYDFPIFKASTLTPYAGIGYRYLNDDTAGRVSSTGALGYERESNYVYIPIGVEVITPLKNNWSFGAMLEYDVFLWGKQISHLSDVDPGFNDPENRQDEGYGIRGSIKFQRKGENINFVIEPFVRYWNIEKSKNADITYYGTYVGYGYEPKNNSTEFGIMFAVIF